VNEAEQVIAEMERVQKHEPDNPFAIRAVANKIQGIMAPANTPEEMNSRADAVTALQELAADLKNADERSWEQVMSRVKFWKKKAGF